MFKVQFLTALVPLLIIGSASAAELPVGETAQGRAKDGRPAVFDFNAESPGVLTVVARGDSDIVIKILNGIGRPLENGTIDTDFGGDSGAEQGAVVIGQSGAYKVRIEPLFGGTVNFVLGASWLPTEVVAREPDPHGSPTDAIALESGKSVDESISQEKNDREDWYRFEAGSNGLLNVATRSESDVVLECYRKDAYEEAAERSDADIGGDAGRESITVDVEKGDVYYFVVTSFLGDADYSIRAVLTDN